MSREDESWVTNYPEIAVSGNLPLNVNIYDNELL